MWCDEEGKCKELPATILVVERKTTDVVELLVGPIVFTANDGHGNNLPLTDNQIEIIREELRPAGTVEIGIDYIAKANVMLLNWK